MIGDLEKLISCVCPLLPKKIQKSYYESWYKIALILVSTNVNAIYIATKVQIANICQISYKRTDQNDLKHTLVQALLL